MAILYVAAEAAELEPFATRLESVRRLKWPLDYACEGVLEGRRVLLAAHGAGPRLAEQAVETAIRAVTAADLSASRLEAVVSTGYCGALAGGWAASDIVIGCAVQDAESGECFACAAIAAAGTVRTGTVVSQNRIAVTADEKGRLAEQGAVAVDMESFGAARRAKRAGIPFYCIKVVTDLAEESFAFDLNRMRTSEGRIARGKIMGYAVTHPTIIPELMKLKRRAEDAARTLGEFLVSCRIQPEPDGDAVR